jgi:hypothetical protein
MSNLSPVLSQFAPHSSRSRSSSPPLHFTLNALTQLQRAIRC